jgi:tetrahydromethanopterin S-methyltransferase subunit B
VDEAEASTRLAEIAQIPLEERVDFLDGLIDDLEAALEETSSPDDSTP